MTHGIDSLLEARARRSTTRAVVLAGGRGTRLSPYTSVLPKPLMPVGGRTILEIVLGQLGSHGITDVTLCVGYLAHLIKAVIGTDSGGVHVSYVNEDQALGTAGPLRSVSDLRSTFLVMNGDVLTTLDYNDLLAFHREQQNSVTIATHERVIKIDYGVLRTGLNGNSGRVRAYVEKPEMASVVSMGIYAVEPEVCRFIPPGGPFDFPDLVQALLDAGEPVGAYECAGTWFDIGRREDYECAVDTWLNGNGAAEATLDATAGLRAEPTSL